VDPRTNPYAPGAGARPPELAGRDAVIERASIALDRVRAGRATKSLLLVGLRGVGKTVLLTRVRLEAEARGITTVPLEALESRALPDMLAPALRAAFLQLSTTAGAADKAQRALRALAGFLRVRVKMGDVELALDANPEKGLADSGDLEHDLSALLHSAGEAARERGTALALFIDELQYVDETELAALTTALHSCVQLDLPVTLLGAGLPQLVGRTGRAKSYAERLFEFPEIGPLQPADARLAIVAPASKLGVEFEPGAFDEILKQTQAYPYFLQEWGKHTWDCATTSPIRLADVNRATVRAVNELDANFFRVRSDRLSPGEKRYLRAMAELGPGPHRSGDIAAKMGKEVQAVAPVRGALIQKGMIYSPAHGDTAFTAPLFDGYMKRTMAL